MIKKAPILYIIIPCFNEELVLPISSQLFLEEVKILVKKDKISADSKILFIDDGSDDSTWEIIKKLSKENNTFCGIRQSRNRGHQNSLLAGLMEAIDKCDIAISIDCDGQDDVAAMEKMIDEYQDGAMVVYGVRSNRKNDNFFKRTTAHMFYHLMRLMGADVIFNHADYRLLSNTVLKELSKYREVNLFLRGMVRLIGYESRIVYYERNERIAGKSHYPFLKMAGFALDGITSFSVRPIRIITCFGFFISLISFVGVIWSVLGALFGTTVPGWASMTSLICFIGGVQVLCLGVIGEYVGKIYLETKDRPRYIVSERTDE